MLKQVDDTSGRNLGGYNDTIGNLSDLKSQVLCQMPRMRTDGRSVLRVAKAIILCTQLLGQREQVFDGRFPSRSACPTKSEKPRMSMKATNFSRYCFAPTELVLVFTIYFRSPRAVARARTFRHLLDLITREYLPNLPNQSARSASARVQGLSRRRQNVSAVRSDAYSICY